MAISLQDLDQILGYDPETHAVKGMPSVNTSAPAVPGRGPANTDVLKTSFSGTRSPIPSVEAQAPDIQGGQTSAGIPSITGAQSPTLEKPKETGWQKLKHGLATVGNIAGNTFAPGVMINTPGTQLHNEFEQTRQAKLAGEGARTEEEKAQAEGIKQGWQPMSITGPNGEQITVPQKFAGTLGAATVRGNTQEDITGKKINATKENLDTTEAGKNTRQQTGITAKEGEQAAALAAKPPKTVVMEDESGKPYEYQYDPKGNYSGAEGQGQWKKLNKAQPNMASMGLVGSLTPLINPQTGEIQGTMNTKTGDIKPIAANALTSGPGAATTSAAARLENTKANQFNTQYVNPANQAEQQFRRAGEAVDAYKNDPKTGAAGMVLFAQHLGTTLGGIKGAAIGEGAQKLHQDAIGLEDRANRYIDFLKTGQPLSANQVHDFYDLITKTRQLQWETTAREGARRNLPIDFLPQDVPIRMSDSAGHVREVPGNQVQSFVEKGAKVE